MLIKVNISSSKFLVYPNNTNISIQYLM